MNISTQNISDTEILALIAENDIEGWQLLYDKYAPIIYGIICSITDNKTIAEEIFVQAFLKIKRNNIVLNTDVSICICLVQYTYTFAKEKLQQKGLLKLDAKAFNKFANIKN